MQAETTNWTKPMCTKSLAWYSIKKEGFGVELLGDLLVGIADERRKKKTFHINGADSSHT